MTKCLREASFEVEGVFDAPPDLPTLPCPVFCGDEQIGELVGTWTFCDIGEGKHEYYTTFVPTPAPDNPYA
jgi:hypothetical protein